MSVVIDVDVAYIAIMFFEKLISAHTGTVIWIPGAAHNDERDILFCGVDVDVLAVGEVILNAPHIIAEAFYCEFENFLTYHFQVT